TLETPDGIWVSNSLACLLAAARATVDPLYPRYFEDFRTVREGLLRYRPSLASSRGPVRLTYYGNLEWDGGRLQQVSKPAPVRDFGSFVKYRAFLGQALRDLADNMGGRERRRPYDFLGTISTGYDSPTVAVLAREAGLATAITVDRSRGGASGSWRTSTPSAALPTWHAGTGHAVTADPSVAASSRRPVFLVTPSASGSEPPPSCCSTKSS